jgi:flagellar protein FlaJ
LSQDAAKGKLRKIFTRLETALHSLRSVFDRLESKKSNEDSTKPQVFAYRLLGEKTIRLLPLFKDMDVNLQKSGMKTSFKGYVSLTLLSTMIAVGSVLVIVPITTLLMLHLSLFLSLLYTVGALFFTAAFSIIGFYLYPIIKKDNLKRNLEDSLPFTTGYLSILAGAGVPPSQMFRSLAKIDTKLAISQEAKNIVRDVELFGFDIITAMDTASKRTPSEKFRDLLEGFIATMHSGGDLSKYLSERSKQYMRLKRIALKRLADSLGVLAEFYVVMLVAGPLILVVMLAVMAMLGGGMPGLMNPRLLLYLLTYLGLPLGSMVFLIMLDMISPKR